MTKPLIQLGTFAFEGLECPEKITVSSRQRIAVHPIATGGSVFDALGEDTQIISFGGIFTGPQAANRARVLDRFRQTGLPMPLIWQAASALVVIHNYRLNFASPYWITYKIGCFISQQNASIYLDRSDILSVALPAAPAEVLGQLAALGMSASPEQIASMNALADAKYSPTQSQILSVRALSNSLAASLAAAADRRSAQAEVASEIGAVSAAMGQIVRLALANSRVNALLINASSLDKK